jgi:hypothetical protein
LEEENEEILKSFMETLGYILLGNKIFRMRVFYTFSQTVSFV